MSNDVYGFNMLPIFNCTHNVVCSSLFGKKTYFPFEQWWKKPLWTFRVCNKNYPVSHGNFSIQFLSHQDSVSSMSRHDRGFWSLLIWGGASPWGQYHSWNRWGRVGESGATNFESLLGGFFWEQVAVCYFFLPWEVENGGIFEKYWKVTIVTIHWRHPFLTSMIKGLGAGFRYFVVSPLF